MINHFISFIRLHYTDEPIEKQTNHVSKVLIFMLVTDVRDEMCWRQLLDVGDG